MLAIIIINYKSERLTIDYIQNELSKIAMPHITIVVNNAATDNSNHYLCEALNSNLVCDIDAPFPQNENNIYVISCEENLGFAKGNNKAVRFLQTHFACDYVLFSNNDIQIVDTNVCERLIEKIEEDGSIGMIGPKVVGFHGEFQSPEPFVPMMDYFCWMYCVTPFISKVKKRERFRLDYSKKAKEGFHYKIMGAFFMVRLSDFVACGMMDEITFLYAEEVILSERMKTINKKVYYFPDVTVVHAHGATTNKTIGKGGINKYLMESMLYYYHVYMHEPQWKCLFCKWIYPLINRFKS